MKRLKFVVRTIRNGQVKINSLTFRPTNRWLEYDGRLDGMRFAVDYSPCCKRALAVLLQMGVVE